jgi:uncharacterized protein YqgV (UPF0045/DUF77 family)
MLGELRVTPVGSRDDFAHVVAGVVRIVSESDLQYPVHAMGTTVEGELDPILDLTRRCHAEVRKHSERVLLELAIDDRAGAQGELVRSVGRIRELDVEVPSERLTVKPRIQT